MHRTFVFSMVLALCFTAAPLLAQSPTSINWHTNVASAVKRASAERKPLVVFFFAEGEDGMLPWSRKLAEGPLASREVFAMQERAVFLKVNVDLDDAAGNAQRLEDGLNIKELPTVAVLETTPQGCIDRGQTVGFFEQAEFIGQLRAQVTHAMIKIRASLTPPLAESEIPGRVAEVQAELSRCNTVLTERATAFRQQLAALLERGEFDWATFAKAAAERDEAHVQLQESIFDLATIPAPEAEAIGAVFARVAIAELDDCRQLQQSLHRLTVEGKLPGPASVERAQSLVRAADKASSEEHKQAQEGLQKARENFNRWLNELAAK